MQVSRRNARERNRVKSVNNGFEDLKRHIPSASSVKKMSKVTILSHAVRYIQNLQAVLKETEDEEEEDGVGDGGVTDRQRLKENSRPPPQTLPFPAVAASVKWEVKNEPLQSAMTYLHSPSSAAAGASSVPSPASSGLTYQPTPPLTPISTNTMYLGDGYGHQHPGYAAAATTSLRSNTAVGVSSGGGYESGYETAASIYSDAENQVQSLLQSTSLPHHHPPHHHPHHLTHPGLLLPPANNLPRESYARVPGQQMNRDVKLDSGGGGGDSSGEEDDILDAIAEWQQTDSGFILNPLD